MTSEQRAAVIAERVMGWVWNEDRMAWVDREGGFCRDEFFLAYASESTEWEMLAQALEALEKWRADKRRRWYQTDSPQSGEHYRVYLYDPGRGGFVADAKVLAEAVVSALIEATTQTKHSPPPTGVGPSGGLEADHD